MSSLIPRFGSSKEQIWAELTRQLGGSLQPGTLLKSDKITVNFQQWAITLDTYTQTSGNTYTTYTRIMAPYVNKDGFKFRIYRKSFFSKIGKILGMQDVEVGYSQFDEDFIIKGNNHRQLVKLFANDNIRNLITRQPKIYFEIKKDTRFFFKKYPENVDILYFEAVGVIDDMELLKELFDLFAEVLDHLCLIGSAYEGKPQL